MAVSDMGDPALAAAGEIELTRDQQIALRKRFSAGVSDDRWGGRRGLRPAVHGG